MNTSPPLRFHSADPDNHLFNFMGDGGHLYQFSPDHDAIGKTGDPVYVCAAVSDFHSFADPPFETLVDFEFFDLRGLPDEDPEDDYCPIDAFYRWIQRRHGRRP